MQRLPSRRRARTEAFTLIELLVVISIIALLIGILLPALGAARASARSLACLSNIRQMGISLNVYANDNDNTLPPGLYNDPAGTDDTDWGVLVFGEFGNSGTTFSNSFEESTRGLRESLRCPEALESTGNNNIVNYSTHPRLLPTIPDTERYDATVPIKLTKVDTIRNPSDLIEVFDAVQVASNSNNAGSVGFKLDGFRMFFGSYLQENFPGATELPGDPIDAGDNTDADDFTGNAGDIRWRHSGESVANFLFLDGHGSAERYLGNGVSSLKRRNVNVNSNFVRP